MTNPRIGLLSCALFAMLASTPAVAAPKLCPELYQPVCAVTRVGVNETYTNACFARQAHARILAPGRCQGPICFFLEDPVCARIPGHRPKTYGNLCLAEVAHATLIHKGACK